MTVFYPALLENDLEKAFFDRIYSQYRKRMLFVANNILHDSFEAEDAVQNALLGIAKHISTVKELSPKKIGAYIFTATHHAALTLCNQKSRFHIQFSIYDLDFIDHNDYFHHLEYKERYQEVLEAMLHLEPIYREVLSLYYISDLSSKQIAGLLERKTRTIEQQLLRGKKQLARILNDL